MSKSQFKHERQLDEFEEYYLPNVQSTCTVFETHLRKVPAGWTYPEHDETMFELNYVVEGEQICRFMNQSYVLKQGDWIIIRPSEKHENYCSSEDGLTYFCLHFDVDDKMFRKLLCMTKNVCFHNDTPTIKHISQKIDALIELCHNQKLHPKSKYMNTLASTLMVLASINDYLCRLEIDAPDISIVNIQLAHQAAERIEQLTYSMDDMKRETSRIATELGISCSHLYRVFSQTYAQSPRQYLSSLLIKKAKSLLLDQQLSIEDVAFNMGYYDLSHFSRQFKRWTGISPSDYRRSSI